MEAKRNNKYLLGEKQLYIKHIGSKDTGLKIVEPPQQQIQKKVIGLLRDAHRHSIEVDSVEYTDVESTLLKLLTFGYTEDTYLVDTLLSSNESEYYIIESDNMQYIICPSVDIPYFVSSGEPISDIIDIYNQLSQIQPITGIINESSKTQIIGSFSTGSILGEYLSTAYNIPHITFNPMLFKTEAKIFKVKGDPFSIFSYNKNKENTFTIVKDFQGLDSDATNLINF